MRLFTIALIGMNLLLTSFSSAEEKKFSELSKDEQVKLMKSFVPDKPRLPEVCAAMRGNGHYIGHHFGALARVIEHWGLVEGIAGGSSGSVTSFFYSSIRSNPAIWFCSENVKDKYKCTKEQTAQRASFLLKTIQAFLDEIKKDVDQLKAELLRSLKVALAEQGIQKILDNPDALKDEKVKAQVANKLIGILTRFDLSDLFNDSLIAAIKKNPEFYVREVEKAVNGFNFSTEDPAILYRLGLINFRGFAHRLGEVADFYASEGLSDLLAQEKMLNSCASEATGITWRGLTQLDSDSASKCVSEFKTVIGNYRKAVTAKKKELLAQNKPYVGTRVRELVGDRLAVAISTSLVEGRKAHELMNDAFERYLDGKTGNDLDLSKDFKFSWVKFGYWGQRNQIRGAVRNLHQIGDFKARKARRLEDSSWEVALSLSPAEPGLASVFCRVKSNTWKDFHSLTKEERLACRTSSAGGWSDLAPVRILQGMGCKNVVYITRRGEASNFAEGVAKHFKMTEHEHKQMYDLDNKNSAFSKALQATAATYCTHWGKKDNSNSVDRMFAHSYSESTMLPNPEQKTTYEFFAKPIYGKFDNINKPKDRYRGCSFMAPAD